MVLEDSTFNFLHGCWNYCFIKTDIDVMILFEFDINYVKLKFKAIASTVFSFDLKLNLLCSYDGCLFMKTVENCLVKILENSISRVSTDQEFLSIIRFCLFNRSNKNRELIESSKLFIKIFFMILINREIHLINQEIHSIDRKLWVLNFHQVFSHLKVQGYM